MPQFINCYRLPGPETRWEYSGGSEDKCLTCGRGLFFPQKKEKNCYENTYKNMYLEKYKRKPM